MHCIVYGHIQMVSGLHWHVMMTHVHNPIVHHDVPHRRHIPRSSHTQSILEQEARVAGFKSEVLKSQELSAATFLRDTERLQSSLDKIKTEVRYDGVSIRCV